MIQVIGSLALGFFEVTVLAAMATGELSLCQAGLTLRELEKEIHVAPPEEKNSDDATAVLLSFPAG